MIMSWLKSWLTKRGGNEQQDNRIRATVTPPNTTEAKTIHYNAAFYANYFSLIAAGARLKLVEAMFSLNLFALFDHDKCILEQDIIAKLGLMPIRAQKWLHLLSSEHFLTKVMLNNQTAYQLPEEFVQLRNSEHWWAMQFFFNSWNVAADENLTDVLHFGKVKTSVSWPPKTDAEALWLEDWMTKTATQPIQCILTSIDFTKINSLLDVGGGDGTMACAFVSAQPHLHATVFNLPKSAEMARTNIASKGLSQQVHVFAGDFINDDSFPEGFDLILFTRVMFDWDERVNRKLLKMAYQALPEGGLVAICEFYKEENNDRCLAAEYRYIFHDDFTPNVMKSAAEYRRMLEETGFTLMQANKGMQANTEKPPTFSYCSVLLARK